jgi:hypothetical protein
VTRLSAIFNLQDRLVGAAAALAAAAAALALAVVLSLLSLLSESDRASSSDDVTVALPLLLSSSTLAILVPEVAEVACCDELSSEFAAVVPLLLSSKLPVLRRLQCTYI